jgi:3-methyladenine DNA glycosylase AlkD
MTAQQVLTELKKRGNENIKKIFLKHGAKEPLYGVKVEDLKKVQKTIKENQQQIALELFASGVGDAQYLAGLMADGAKMNTKELQTWAEKAEWPMISECTVAWVTIENEAAWKLALQWIDSSKENVACSGWTTLGSMMAVWPDEKLDMAALKKLLARVQKEIHKAPNRVRKSMNNFLIAAGSYVKELNQPAIETGKKMGVVMVDMGDTSCKIPFAPDYIQKATARGSLGKKKKTAKC